MRAVVHDRYGPPEVLRLEDVEPPVPADDEALVRVYATTVTRSDCGWRAAKPFPTRFFTGILRPKRRILGSDFAGTVEAVGRDVTEFAAGDEVFGTTGSFGAHAELLCVRESGAIARKPAGVSFAEAGAVSDGAILALNPLRLADLRPGRRLLVYGASGAIGTAGVQLGKHFGAHVTAVCDTKNLDVVRSLGPDEVIDYTQEDFTKSGETYDVVLDAVGKFSFARSRRSLAPGGLYVATDRPYNFPLALLTKWVGERKVVFSASGYKRESVLLLKELLEAGKYRPVVDRTYPLDEVVDATRYVESWQKAGNVVLAMGAAS